MANKVMESDETGFSHDELIQALLDAQIDGIDSSGVMTGSEISLVLGVSTNTMLKRVKRLLRDGVIESAPKQIVNTLGITTTTRGYRLKV